MGDFVDDDVIPAVAEEAIVMSPKYRWFQQPAPTPTFTFIMAGISMAFMTWFYVARVIKLRQKFGDQHFKGSLRACALISAYMDNYGYPRFATLRLCTKSFFFLGLLQLEFQRGFWIMCSILIVESSLDTIRVLLAYRNCSSIDRLTTLSAEEAQYMRSTTTLNPTNVYEDLTRPKSIAVMVFLVQGMLIGLVMDDTYMQTTRTCFDGTDGCKMLTSLGSYCLYLMGTFMACVFYIGPRNSYGQKEQNPTFWLKLFLLAKEKPSILSWTDPITDEAHTILLAKNDYRIWFRFIESSIVNGIGFHFLLHVLPIQVAGQSTIIGVVFRAIGMIYLADLDDSSGGTLTLLPNDGFTTSTDANKAKEESSSSGGYQNGSNNSTGDVAQLEAAKQKIVNDAVADVQAKLQALMRDGVVPTSAFTGSNNRKMDNITNALLMAAARAKRKKDDAAAAANEKTKLIV